MIKNPYVLAILLALPTQVLAAEAKNWPAPIKALQAEGVEVVGTFKAPSGLTGYAGRVGQQPLAIYLTGDGKYAIVGTMIDGKGNNLSEKPVADLVDKPMTEQVWKQLGQSTWVGDGKSIAPRIVYAFTDPNCPYCHKFWNDARPWVTSGKVQLRHVMVGILSPTSPGKAAAILAARDPEAALTRHEQEHAAGGVKPLSRIPQKTAAQLAANQKLMQQLGLSATPTVFYKDASGKVRKIQGAPSTGLLTEVLGPR
ncbi:MAG: thiol:disulfide interchange protein DsbG [Betaproteobacteria bacterium]|nr:thiol:disulfide interchange protein DsbG [Betaproteobacteria bacterium]